VDARAGRACVAGIGGPPPPRGSPRVMRPSRRSCRRFEPLARARRRHSRGRSDATYVAHSAGLRAPHHDPFFSLSSQRIVLERARRSRRRRATGDGPGRGAAALALVVIDLGWFFLRTMPRRARAALRATPL
jgi:hypothetical protein